MFEWLEIFSVLTDDEKNKLSLFCQERFLKKWDILFKEWDEAIALYVLKQWKLRAYKDRSDGEKILWFIESGEMVWEMAIFDIMEHRQSTRMASIKAEQDSFLIVIMNYSILELSKNNPIIYTKILDIINNRKEKNNES